MIKEYRSLAPCLKEFFKQNKKEVLTNKHKRYLVLTENNKVHSVLDYEYLPWDSELLRVKAFRINDFYSYATVKQKIKDFESSLEFLLKGQESSYYFIFRVSPPLSGMVKCLEKYGFKYLNEVVDLVYKPGIKNKVLIENSSRELSVDLYQEKDFPALYKIAGSSFSYNRFHKETWISKKQADFVHQVWFENCCKQKVADKVWVAKYKDRPVGFHACKIGKSENEVQGRIVLIGVDNRYKGRGIGSSLVGKALAWFEGKVSKIMVRTEAENKGAVALYKKCGFKEIERSKYYTLKG